MLSQDPSLSKPLSLPPHAILQSPPQNPNLKTPHRGPQKHSPSTLSSNSHKIRTPISHFPAKFPNSGGTSAYTPSRAKRRLETGHPQAESRNHGRKYTDNFTDDELQQIGLGYDWMVRFMEKDNPNLRHPHDWYKHGEYGAVHVMRGCCWPTDPGEVHRQEGDDD
ncbi:hypothetical protein ACFX13_007908 [Malus domestica]